MVMMALLNFRQSWDSVSAWFASPKHGPTDIGRSGYRLQPLVFHASPSNWCMFQFVAMMQWVKLRAQQPAWIRPQPPSSWQH